MVNPYSTQPDYAFWRRAMSGCAPPQVDPVTSVPFVIESADKVATAGSCFAQHISRTLLKLGFAYLVTEGDLDDEDYGVFSARFGNVYSARQLLQLLRRAYGLFDPVDIAWMRPDGRYIDPFRPHVAKAGFVSATEVVAERAVHLGAVRRMFEECDVFVFTLGLTESWVSNIDGAVFPLAPGVVSDQADPESYRYHNFSVSEVEADLTAFISLLRTVNPQARLILTVSPVPLIATYEHRHVLVSTTYSKSVLRVAAETVSRTQPSVAYFPSYEIITGPHSRGAFYEEDLREVKPEAVALVMSIFAKHYLGNGQTAPAIAPASPTPTHLSAELRRIVETEKIICDEQVLDRLP